MIKKILLLLSLNLFILTNLAASPKIEAKTSILIDYNSGKILHELEPDMSIYPASMTKIMTSIIAFDLLKKEKLKLDDEFIVSEGAWRMSRSGYSSMFIMLNDKVSVEDLLRGIIVVSGNDACVTLAEGIAGSESNFAEMMNEKAEEIGLTNTNFTNSSGLNDPDNYSTVRDIALMSEYLIRNFPNYYEYFKEKEFTWDRTGGDPITQGNRNPLLYKKLGADGIKTGYLAVEKYSLASSIIKNNRRLIAVGSGFATKSDRSKQSQKLHIWGLTNFDLIEIARNNKHFTELDVWHGKKNKIKVYVKDDIYKTVKKAKKRYLKAIVNYNGPIHAPIFKDDKVGKLKVYYKDDLLDTYDLYAYEKIKRLNIISRLIKSLNYLIWGDV